MTSKEGFWEISIRKVDNGFVCSWEEESDGGEVGDAPTFIKHEQVFEEKENFMSSENKDELENMKNLLYFVKEYFAIMYSKHNKANLTIEIKEEKNENETIE
jgi:hypothetical protein